MDIPSWRIAILTVAAFATLSSNPPAVAEAPHAAVAAVSLEPVNSPTVYEVQPGDTLWKIARRFHVDLDQLAEWNSAEHLKKLAAGTKLTIPGKPKWFNTAQPVLVSSKQIVYTRAGQPIPYSRVLTCKLTAYTAGPESTGKKPGDPGYGITYSGKQAEEGRTVAVDPKLIPIGSQVYIEGIGFRVAEDTGAAVKGEHIDIFFNDVQTAREFGVQTGIPVYVLN